jgi:hypothetical protein
MNKNTVAICLAIVVAALIIGGAITFNESDYDKCVRLSAKELVDAWGWDSLEAATSRAAGNCAPR